MNAEIINYPQNLEDQIIEDSKLFYPDIELQKSDLERFVRKCFRDENFSFFIKYVIIFKINSTFFTFNEISSLKYNISKPEFLSDNFSLSSKLKNNEKIGILLSNYLKKLNLILSDEKESTKEKDFLCFYPQICNINYLQSQNIFEWLNFCSLKEYNNVSFELKTLSENIYDKLSEKYPFFFNQLTYKVFLKVIKRR